LGSKYTPQAWADLPAVTTPINAARLTVMENAIRDASMGRSTTFPSSPVDGDIHVYPADLTNGVMWHFMYRSAPNDWEFIGGSPLYAEIATAEGTSSTSYVALATAGPSIAIPIAGDYMVEVGFTVTTNSSFSRTGTMSYDIGGTAAVDADGCVSTAANSLAGQSGYFVRRKTGLTAVTLTAKYKTHAATDITTFAKRWMKVTPIRYTP
jgi:hypothetical protein